MAGNTSSVTTCVVSSAIVAITDNRRLVLVEQHRAALDARVIELPPAWSAISPGLNTKTSRLPRAANCSKKPVTRLRGWSLSSTGRWPPPSSSLITYFRARGLKKVHAGGGDENEEIIVHEVPLASADAWWRPNARVAATWIRGSMWRCI